MVSLLSGVKPLKEYINDKKEMIEVMFSCIEENQLKKMIPDVLKDVRPDDLKAECLVELLGMSKKRIVGILEGRELDESSEDSLELSDISDDDDIKSEGKSLEKTSRKKDQKEAKSTTSKKNRQISTSDSDREEVPVKKKKVKKKLEDVPAVVTSVRKAKGQVGKSNHGQSQNETENPSPSPLPLSLPAEEKQGTNLLEILELEMRARAIRSLLQREEKKNKEPGDAKPSTSIEPEGAAPSLESLDNDPDAVILIDEATDQIDLTKDESDSEQQECNIREDGQADASKDKLTSFQVRNYRSNKEHSQTPSSKNLPMETQKDSEDVLNPSEKDKTPEVFVPRNWTERWLDSSDVQKVMKTTKVLTNLKKRLIKGNKLKSSKEKEPEQTKEVVPFEGTIDEYSQLPSKLIHKNNAEESELNLRSEEVTNPTDNNGDIESAVETFISKDEMNTITQSESNDDRNTSKTTPVEDLPSPIQNTPIQDCDQAEQLELQVKKSSDSN